MKRFITVLLIIFSFMFVFSVSLSAFSMTHRFAIGGGMIPFEISGLKDMDVTDRYDDEGNLTGVAEGRIFMKLEDKKAEGMHPGLLLGYGLYLMPEFGLNLDLGFYSTENTSLISGYFGIEYRIINSESFYIGIIPKVGFLYAKLDLGKTEVASGYAPPVYVYEDGVHQPDKSIYDGEELSASFTAFSYQILLSMGFKLTPSIELFAQGGFTQAFFGDLEIETDKATIPKDSFQLVDHGTNDRAKPEPEVKSVGGFFVIGVAYNWHMEL